MVKKISEEKDTTEVVEEKVKKTKEVSPEATAEKKPAVKKTAAPKVEKVEAVKEEKAVAPKKPKVKKVVEDNRKYATGKRKDSVARVWISVGKGEFSINGRTLEHYFKRPILRMMVNQPFSIVNAESKFDVFSTVEGGGLSGQAGALRHGISKALVEFDAEYRGGLKSQGFLTRDSRVVERKKYGRKKARKRFQFSKR